MCPALVLHNYTAELRPSLITYQNSAGGSRFGCLAHCYLLYLILQRVFWSIQIDRHMP